MMLSAIPEPLSSSPAESAPPSRKRAVDAAQDSASAEQKSTGPAPPSERTRQAIVDHMHRSRFAMKTVAVGAFYMARDEGMLSYLRLLPTDMCEAIIVPMLSEGYAGVSTTTRPGDAFEIRPDDYPYRSRNIAPLFSYKIPCTKSIHCQCDQKSEASHSVANVYNLGPRVTDIVMAYSSDSSTSRAVMHSDGATDFIVAPIPSVSILLQQSETEHPPPIRLAGSADPKIAQRSDACYLICASIINDDKISGLLQANFSDKHGHFKRIGLLTIDAGKVSSPYGWDTLETKENCHIEDDDPTGKSDSDSENSDDNNSSDQFDDNGDDGPDFVTTKRGAFSNSPAHFVLKVKTPGRRILLNDFGKHYFPTVKVISSHYDQTQLYDDEGVERPRFTLPTCPYNSDIPVEKQYLQYAATFEFVDNDSNPHFLYILAVMNHVQTLPSGRNIGHCHFCVFVYSANTLKCVDIIHLDITPLPHRGNFIRQNAEILCQCTIDGAGNFVVITYYCGSYHTDWPHVAVWSPDGCFIKQRNLLIRSSYRTSAPTSLSLTNTGFLCHASPALLEYFCLDDENILSREAALAYHRLR